MLLMKGNNQETVLKYNKDESLFIFDRSKNGKDLGGKRRNFKNL